MLPALGLVAAVWFGTLRAIDAQRREAEDRVTARINSQAASLQAEIYRQVLELNQTLQVLAGVWEADPSAFNLAAWRDRAAALSDLSRDLLIADKTGHVVQSTGPDPVGTDVSRSGFFLDAAQHNAGTAAIEPPALSPTTHQWYMPVERRLQLPDDTFGGAVVAYWRASAVADQFRTADLGTRPLAELVGLNDGRLRAVTGPAGTPGQQIANTPMFAALRASPNDVWTGRSAPDNLVRLHAFRLIPGSDLAVVVGIDPDEALAPSRAWAFQANLFAGCVSVLILAMAGLLLLLGARERHRRAAQAFDQMKLTSADSRFEAARAHADTKAAQLQVTLEGMTDGVAMIDAQLCLVEWNHLFPEIAGVPPELLRVGRPMEDILRAQAQGGQFGEVDVEAEVARRLALLRSGGSIGVIQRPRPDGRSIELRRNQLPDGGFVTLYTDITARKQAEDALREARAIAEAATEAKSRFVAIVSHEIRTPLNALLGTLALLQDSGLPPAQLAMLNMARQSGDALLGLINDILEMSRMEAGQLTLRPSVFTLGVLLEGVTEIFRAQAAERGIALALITAPDTPQELYADPGRLRQVLINLLSNAVKFGQPGAVGLLAGLAQESDNPRMLWLAVRDRGPVIEPAGRERLFRPFSRLEGGEPSAAEPLGSGLGLAICRQIISLMGGEIGCNPWFDEDGHAGNEFWIRLPIVPAPDPRVRPAAAAPLVRRVLPRSRILLVEDILANQLVTATLLRREGHLVDIASDGPEALQAVAHQPYDLVFLDIFMPGMSGYEVAQQIRAMPAPASTTPIVALTANASPDDQTLSLRAGMTRLLGKPVSLPEMVEALAELTWRGLPQRNAAVGRIATAPPRSPVLSAERIGELRNSLPGDMLSGMVEECLIDMQARLPVLRGAVQSGNSEDIAAQAHIMVGMAAGYGMAALETRLRALMLAARGNDAARAAALAAELDTELSMAATALREAVAIELV